jgi:hypothetical protein
MALLQGNQGQSGKQVGQSLTVGFGEYSEVLITELMPRYYEQTYRGNMFNASNQAAVTAPAALTASSVNFTLYNPLGSGKNLVLAFVDITVAQLAETTAGSYQVLLVANAVAGQAAPATTTALATISTLLGSGAQSVAKAFSTATLAAVPVVIKPLLSITSAAAITGAIANGSSDNIGGTIVVAPGSYISVQGIGTSETTSPGLIVGMTWAEIPV